MEKRKLFDTWPLIDNQLINFKIVQILQKKYKIYRKKYA